LLQTDGVDFREKNEIDNFAHDEINIYAIVKAKNDTLQNKIQYLALALAGP